MSMFIEIRPVLSDNFAQKALKLELIRIAEKENEREHKDFNLLSNALAQVEGASNLLTGIDGEEEDVVIAP
jgi:hypothetical protein